MKTLNDLVKSLLVYERSDERNPTITSMEMDSREVQPGSVFICVKGYTVDGHDFVDRAVQAGAVAIVAEREVDTDVPVIIVNDTVRALAILANVFYNHPSKKTNLIGVTGTNGKTTTTHLIEQVLADANEKTGLIGTMYMKIAGQSFNVKNTTPDALFLQKAFADMVKAEVDTAVMEVSSHALHMGRVRGCDFNIAVFTNLTPDHLDYHETMEAYRHAKGLLFAQLGNTYDEQIKKIAVLNHDDPASQEYKKMTTAHVLSYGIDTKSDVMATAITMEPSGTQFLLKAIDQTVPIHLKLIGKFSVYNALAATAACLARGIPLNKIKESLEAVEGVDGRFEVVDAGQRFAVIVDYAHTADSLENVLITAKEFAKGSLIVVVGCGGDRDRTKRPVMAKIATTYADTAIFTSDNPRSENPEVILKDMEAGVADEDYVKITDRRRAIDYAIKQAKDDDIVIIAGKGHETYQIIGNETLHFDDREVSRKAIKERDK